MPTKEGRVTRCEIRVPNELYSQIEALATKKGARIHHRSGKVEVTGTILELLKLGLSVSDHAADMSDKLSDSQEISGKVSDNISEIREQVTPIINESVQGAIVSLREEVLKK